MDTTQVPPHVGHRAVVDTDHIGNMGRYIYQIRNILAWMLVIWLVSLAAAVGVGLWLGHQSASQDSGTVSNTACQPAGTINPC